MKPGPDIIVNTQTNTVTMKTELETANNLIFTYDFESMKWNKIGHLNERKIQVYTCTTFHTKDEKRY